MRVVTKLFCVMAILGAAIFFASDASAQCSTVNPTCDLACSVLKYCPGPIACNVDTDCGVGGARCITGFCRGGRPTGGCHPACRANQRCACPPWDTQCLNSAFGQCKDLPRPGGGTGGAGGGGSGTGSPPACGGHGPAKLRGVCETDSDCGDNQRCQGHVCKPCGPTRPPAGPACTTNRQCGSGFICLRGHCTAV
jgi:hypothetical protein